VSTIQVLCSLREPAFSISTALVAKLTVISRCCTSPHEVNFLPPHNKSGDATAYSTFYWDTVYWNSLTTWFSSFTRYSV